MTSISQADTAPPGSHSILDRKDDRSHKATAQAAQAEQKLAREAEEAAKAGKPTDAAVANKNKPSRGAEIDEELEKEEEEIIRKKDEAGVGAGGAKN